MITLTSARSFAASTTASISFELFDHLFDFNAPILMTISTSSAPLLMASVVSNAFVSDVFAPKGNPITVHTATGSPCNCSFASATHAGLMQTE